MSNTRRPRWGFARFDPWRRTAPILGAKGESDMSTDLTKHAEVVQRVHPILADYQDRHDQGTEPEELAADLVADVLHWASAQGLDVDDVLRSARLHWEEEVSA